MYTTKKTVRQYCKERGHLETQAMKIKQDELKYMEENISLASTLMPELGKVYVVLNDEGYVDEEMSKTLQELSQLNYQRSQMLDKLTKAV